MNPLIDSINNMFGSNTVDQISNALGGDTDRNPINEAIGSATPALMSGLAGRLSEGGESAASMQKMLGDTNDFQSVVRWARFFFAVPCRHLF